MADWRESAKVVSSGDWRDRAIVVSPGEPTYTQGGFDTERFEAVGKGALKGITFDRADEIIAGIKAGVKALRSPSKIKEIYAEEVKKERDELKRLEEKYPLEFIGSELGAALGSSFLIPIPGTTAARGAGLVGRVGTFGARLLPEAALQASGAAEAPFLSKQYFKETAAGTTGGLIGGGIVGGIGKAGGKLLQKGQAPLKRLTQYLSEIVFDLPMAYTERLLDPKKAQKILNPKSSNDIINNLVSLVDEMGDHAKALSLKATKFLSDAKDIATGIVKKVDEKTGKVSLETTDGIFKEIMELPVMQDVMSAKLSKDLPAKKELKKIAEQIMEYAGEAGSISQKKIKRLIQRLDEQIPWDSREWGLKEKMIGDIRSFLDHNYLKITPAYEAAMKPVAALTKTLKDISKSFTLKRDGYKLSPSDETYSKVKNFFDVKGFSKKPVTEEALAKAEKQFPKYSILEDIETSQIAARSEGGVRSGARNVLGAALLGGSISKLDPSIMAAYGALGYVKDVFGRKVGKHVIPQLQERIDIADQNLKRLLEGVDPDTLARILGTPARVIGTDIGTQSQYPLLPRSK